MFYLASIKYYTRKKRMKNYDKISNSQKSGRRIRGILWAVATDPAVLCTAMLVTIGVIFGMSVNDRKNSVKASPVQINNVGNSDTVDSIARVYYDRYGRTR